MPWAVSPPVRPSAGLTFALLVIAFVGTLLCPTVAYAEAVGYCSDQALSDVAPAPMVPVGSDVLEEVTTDCKGLPGWLASQAPVDDGPHSTSPERVERAWPALHSWSSKQQSIRATIDSEGRQKRPGYRSSVYRPPNRCD